MKNMFTEGLKGLAVGMLIVAEIPIAVIKTVVENVTGKQETKKTEIEVKEVDISNLEKDAQDWIKECYNKKNGLV